MREKEAAGGEAVPLAIVAMESLPVGGKKGRGGRMAAPYPDVQLSL